MFKLCNFSLLLLVPVGGKLIELDYALIPRNSSNLFGLETLQEQDRLSCTKKGAYSVKEGNTNEFIQERTGNMANGTNTTLEYVLGTNKSVYFDDDWGMFSSVLASYNNHWILKTTPDDWWTVAIRRIAQALDEHGDIEEVRAFFVDHQGKKTININVGPSLSNINYSWLFDQFSSGVRENINTPGYVDLVQADFSATTSEQKIISQVMLMASVKKYFSFEIYTLCGIPGVDLQGTQEDWAKLVKKLADLAELLKPIQKHLGLETWFSYSEKVFSRLLDTYGGNPNMEWWGKILSWNHGGSGTRSHWSGWFPFFLGANAPPPSEEGDRANYYDERMPADPADFPSGLVSVPLKITDGNNSPPLEGEGLLVAGTLGFTVEDSGKFPSVQPTQVWSLLLPSSQEELKQRFIG